mmetsp:Transcript_40561/g.66646  ORF Transcript_40561/g.66646 Transcript_40561/m.66646 type:complete len:219 (-) Transcript_40561:41-697(-)
MLKLSRVFQSRLKSAGRKLVLVIQNVGLQIQQRLHNRLLACSTRRHPQISAHKVVVCVYIDDTACDQLLELLVGLHCITVEQRFNFIVELLALFRITHVVACNDNTCCGRLRFLFRGSRSIRFLRVSRVIARCRIFVLGGLLGRSHFFALVASKHFIRLFVVQRRLRLFAKCLQLLGIARFVAEFCNVIGPNLVRHARERERESENVAWLGVVVKNLK